MTSFHREELGLAFLSSLTQNEVSEKSRKDLRAVPIYIYIIFLAVKERR